MKRVPTLEGEPVELAQWRTDNPADDGSLGAEAKGEQRKGADSDGALDPRRYHPPGWPHPPDVPTSQNSSSSPPAQSAWPSQTCAPVISAPSAHE